MNETNIEMGRMVIGKLRRPVRWMVLGILVLTLLIPLEMVESVVAERHATYRGVVDDIAGSWAGEQLLAGPFLIVPFTERYEIVEEYVTREGEKRATSRWERRQRHAIVLPEELEISGTLVPEARGRGIYEVQVYTADLVVSGIFTDLDARVRSLSTSDDLDEIEWSKSVVGFGLSDPRGIADVDGFQFNEQDARPNPGTALGELAPKGFHVAVGSFIEDELAFRLPMAIRGSGSLRFLPLGQSTRATLESEWPHPSFVGDVLPTNREIGDAGFTGAWTIPLLNRSYPQAWTTGQGVDINEIEAGVRLFEPVALYDQITRSVKYGLLFIVLTFLTLGLVELVTGTRLSPVQFLLIGVGLALFFLVLVALAEHMGFATAYLLASATVIVINTAYCAAILPRRSLSVAVGGVLAAIYGVLYTILEAEDYALLGGTALLVVALAVTMFFTRRLHIPNSEA